MDVVHKNNDMNFLPEYRSDALAISGEYIRLSGETWYKISNCHLMDEFFICPVSSGDHWMFITSRGALTAGRKNSDSAIFPYAAADQISDCVNSSGPKTIVRVSSGKYEGAIWEPFSFPLKVGKRLTQNVAKNTAGDKLQFEEINWDLELVFQYEWAFSQVYGFVRSCRLLSFGKSNVGLSVLDGLQNILPAGLDERFQNRFSNLGDAYKRSEWTDDPSLGLYYLSSIPTDRAEPNECLSTSVAWHFGIQPSQVLISSRQVDAFRRGSQLHTERELRAHRGAYFVSFDQQLSAGDNEVQWSSVVDTGIDYRDLVRLKHHLADHDNLADRVAGDVKATSERLLNIVSQCDGNQLGAKQSVTHRHRSNVIFNTMRGGVPMFNQDVSRDVLIRHVQTRNGRVYERNHGFLNGLPDRVHLKSLVADAQSQNDPSLVRLISEFMPLTFGRRHGDPTRPWNKFDIQSFLPDGSPKLSYQGNWRDVFQNWEALTLSFPEFSSTSVLRFVNASTADGYNPYRISQDGLEWETIEPDDPWANIGYWGDHQIVYLLRLLKQSRRLSPRDLEQWLGADVCSYANVPYAIKDHDAIVADPQNTVEFLEDKANRIDEQIEAIGGDGKLLLDKNLDVIHVSLLEKLLVPALVKLTNFVPGGGIWMNTQRPEWNDANNALVGRGLSMVTTCYLREYFCYLRDWSQSSETGLCSSGVNVSTEVVQLLDSVKAVLRDVCFRDGAELSSATRRRLVDAFGEAGSRYRSNLYQHGLSGRRDVVTEQDCVELFDLAIHALDQTICSNERPDGLFHSYNLLELGDNTASIERMREMLEGQVAILSCGLLEPARQVRLLEALRESALYQSDRQSFLLYPDRELPSFMNRNVIDRDVAATCPLIEKLVQHGSESIVIVDDDGQLHFHSDLRQAACLEEALDALAADPKFNDAVESDRETILQLYEDTFDHGSFTGRSQNFFAYEGLGSIYWHMVSKLALATIENATTAAPIDPVSAKELHRHYRLICEGIGATKSPDEFGAFPFDPHSHTPAHAGAQQPGMTGQVKEDILSRFIEIGIRIHDGKVTIDPALFDPEECITQPETFDYLNLAGQRLEMRVESGCFAFSLWQVPFVYFLIPAEESTGITVHWSDESLESKVIDGLTIPSEVVDKLLARNGEVQRIEIRIHKSSCWH